MDLKPLTTIAAQAATEVIARYEPSPEARALVRPDLSPADYVAGLWAAGRFVDAIQFLAHALPKREAVWWACACVRSVPVALAGDPAEAALRAAEAWCADPSEEHRRAAETAAAEAGPASIAGCTALGAFWSGGSLAPASLAAVPPAENLTGKAVFGAVVLAAVSQEPEKAAEKYQGFASLALDILAGTKSWPAPKPSPAPPAGPAAPPKQPARPAAVPPRRRSW